MLKKWILLIALAMLLMCAAGAYAEDVSSMIYNMEPFTFYGFKDEARQLYYSDSPIAVYTAPSRYAYRDVARFDYYGNPRFAEVSFDPDIYYGACVGNWMMIRYELNNGGYRVGYVNLEDMNQNQIDPYIVEKQRSRTQDSSRGFNFRSIQQTAQDYIEVNDNPMDTTGRNDYVFAQIEPGDTYWILGKYNYHGNWLYIEFYVGNQVARGFIPRNSVSLSSGSSYSYSGGSSYSYSSGNSYSNPGVNNDSYSSNNAAAVSGLPSAMGYVRAAQNNVIVREKPNPDSSMVARIDGSGTYPVYADDIGSTGKVWYYISVDGLKGWVSSGVVYYWDN